MSKRRACIVSTGSYVPKKVLSNAELEKMVDTSDEWIQTRTGILERRIAGKEECSSDMGVIAARRALKKAGVLPSELDGILVATLTPDYIFPATACLIQNALEAPHVMAFDIQAACSGYLYALSVAEAFIAQGKSRILIVAPEKLSAIVNYQDRSTCVLFGDGAAACLVAAGSTGLQIDGICLGADGSQSHLLRMEGGGCKHPASKETVENNLHYIQMAGSEVFKHAVLRMKGSCETCLEQAGLQESDIDWLIPHQANVRIIDAMGKRFSHIPPEKICKTIHKYGNTSCSSIGIALDELWSEGKLRFGDRCLLTAFGAGFTWGSCILTKVEEQKR
ncbi:MAG: beta-ketoacyl-ACP synthase III [Chlamydiota bacterium]